MSAKDFARASLAAYAIWQWNGYRVARHHRLIAQTLERVATGEIKRLMIWAPPRHGKSKITSRFFPAWYLGNNPTHQVIASTYSQDFANDWGREVRDCLLDPKHRAAFPKCQLRTDSASSSHMQTTAGGVYNGVGVGGPITGRGADLFLIDDPYKNHIDAESSLIRERIWKWYQSTAYTRLMPGGRIVVIQTRWHEDDLCGRILREQPNGWHLLKLPAVADADDAMGRAIGEALWPESFPRSLLDEIAGTIGTYFWQALYQQNPSSAEGNIFKRDWWQRYIEAPTRFDRIIGSWDLSFKDTKGSDFVAGQAWGAVGSNYYLLDRLNKKLAFSATRLAIKAQKDRWGPKGMTGVYVEDKANGPAVINSLTKHVSGLVPVEPHGSKIARAYSVSPIVEAGNVWLPQGPSWVAEFIDQLASFPSGKNDDEVDACTQALMKLELDVSRLDFLTQMTPLGV